MSDYQAVTRALEDGADPGMLCTTCPWDRICIIPPVMTSAEIDQEVKKATEKDRAEMTRARLLGEDPGIPAGSLLTVLMIAGQDTSAQVCPVFALRLRSSGGRKTADSLKAAMQAWDDDQA